jgi:hypothetical protein
MRTKFSTETVESLAESLNSEINIQGVNKLVVYEYFVSLNSGEFMVAAGLFAEQACLNTPFDKQLQGREVIAQYLEQEAKRIRFFPECGEILTNLVTAATLENCDRTQYQIQGKVEINWFTVNISWSIKLNAPREIVLVDVKLLTSLSDLLSFSRI